LPIPSYARVTNLTNGKQIIVRINDRGPFHSSRIMDLSYTAALKLGYLSSGSSQIQVERLLPDDIEKMAENRKNQLPGVAAASPLVTPLDSKQQEAKPDSKPEQISIEELLAMQEKAAEGKPVESLAPASNASQQGEAATGYYIQFGAFAIRANAEEVMGKLKSRLEGRLPTFDIVQQGTLYRLLSGPFASRGEASAVLLQVGGLGVARPVIVQR
jgi:rare lipoprotein A